MCVQSQVCLGLYHQSVKKKKGQNPPAKQPTAVTNTGILVERPHLDNTLECVLTLLRNYWNSWIYYNNRLYVYAQATEEKDVFP